MATRPRRRREDDAVGRKVSESQIRIGKGKDRKTGGNGRGERRKPTESSGKKGVVKPSAPPPYVIEVITGNKRENKSFPTTPNPTEH
jgi:hypothetical protein